MTCREAVKKIPLFLEDALSEHECLLFNQHIQGCARCRECFSNARKNAQDQGKWVRILAVLNVILVILAAIYFAFGPALIIKICEFLKSEKQPQSFSQSVSENSLQMTAVRKIQSSVQLKPLHWDIFFQDRSKLEFLDGQLREKGIKIFYQNPGLLVLAINSENIDSLQSILTQAGGSFQNGGTLYSFKLPEVDGDFRISINLKFPQARVSQPLAHHWHLNFHLPNRFTAKDSIRRVGAKFLYEVPEIWVVEIPGRSFNQLKDALTSTHGVEVDFGAGAISADAYREIPLTISLYISEG